MDALLVVDFQNDFTPGGALPVEHGDEIAAPINAIADRFDLVVATRDWHPPDHGSFVGVEVDPEQWHGIDPPGIWPVHCVQGTPGAELHPALDQSKVDLVIDKAQDRYTQGYSGFHGGDLADVLRERGRRPRLRRRARDRLLREEHRARRGPEGFGVTVVTDAIRGIDVEPGDSRARDRGDARGRRHP